MSALCPPPNCGLSLGMGSAPGGHTWSAGRAELRLLSSAMGLLLLLLQLLTSPCPLGPSLSAELFCASPPPPCPGDCPKGI